jgi:hypothetical protein
MIPTLLLLWGCEKDTGETCTLTARPAAVPVAGDPNGDGVVDMADGTAVLSALFRAGPRLACEAAGDIDLTDAIDAGDGVALWYGILTGTSALPTLADGACTKVTREVEPVCGDGLALAIDAPKSVTASEPVTVTLTPGGIDVEALAFGLRTNGCTVASATFAGTVAADRRDDPPGLRDGGFARVDLAADGLVAAIAWDVAGDQHLPASQGASAVLSVLLTPSGGSCGTCTLTIADGVVGAGDPVTTVAASGGYGYVPVMGSASVEVCP